MNNKVAGVKKDSNCDAYNLYCYIYNVNKNLVSKSEEMYNYIGQTKREQIKMLKLKRKCYIE